MTGIQWQLQFQLQAPAREQFLEKPWSLAGAASWCGRIETASNQSAPPIANSLRQLLLELAPAFFGRGELTG